MIASDDLRPMPLDYDPPIEMVEIDGVRRALCYKRTPEGAAEFGFEAILNADAAMNAVLLMRLRLSMWQASEMLRLRETDPDDIAWRERMTEQFGASAA